LENTNSKNIYALIWGCSSGFEAAISLGLAKEGFQIFSVHLDRKATMSMVEEVRHKILKYGTDLVFLMSMPSMKIKEK